MARLFLYCVVSRMIPLLRYMWCNCCQVIQACMDLLTADRANIMVLSKRYGKPGFCDHREKWFKTPYRVEGQFTLHWYVWCIEGQFICDVVFQMLQHYLLTFMKILNSLPLHIRQLRSLSTVAILRHTHYTTSSQSSYPTLVTLSPMYSMSPYGDFDSVQITYLLIYLLSCCLQISQKTGWRDGWVSMNIN